MRPLTTYALIAAIALPVAFAPAARAASEAANLVDRARITVQDLKHDKEFGNARELLRHAKGVLIVPSLVKGGFFFGAEGGAGVLLSHNGASWGYPAFYTLASASFGLQIGLEKAELVLIVMTDRALQALMRDEFKIGAGAGLAIVTLGSSVEGATTAAAGADIVVWASASGAYAGVSINGSIVKPRTEWDASYYGRPVSSADIVIKGNVHNGGADVLRRDLATVK